MLYLDFHSGYFWTHLGDDGEIVNKAVNILFLCFFTFLFREKDLE